MGISAILVSLYSVKELIKIRPDLSIPKLVAISIIIGFLGDGVIQVIRYFNNYIDAFTCVRSALFMALYYGIFAFFTAFQLKTHKTNVLWIMIITFIVITNVAIRYFQA